ncbi:hypothetical protein Cgig2_001333 [Carnegiea gigantea]|uniref:Chlororespiratory reduction 2 n=1 Tax=Carnegiea gigantea TaxID=171969 RepID=A0A9Q1KUJ2_9CARY|nr:hypothetical protein Cgig2_001333 [Carnegiea gigantea]
MLCSHFVHHLRACAKLSSQSLGQKLHAQIIKLGLQQYGPLPNSLLEMYGKCGVMGDALQMFDEMPQRDIVSWASTLTAYNHAGLPRRSLSIFAEMWEHDRLQPDHFVIASLVKACASLGDVRLGKQVHAYFVRSPFYDDDVAKSSLVDMYSKCGFPHHARTVFNLIRVKGTVSWTALISGYAQTGRKGDALELFSRMPVKNLLSWSALISGLVQSGHGIDAFSIFMKMRKETDHGIDPFILSAIIAACANMAMLELGKQVHCLALALCLDSNLFVSNALVDMYAKCSDLLAAKSIFTNTRERDVVTWTSIIVGTAQHGQAKEALSLYDEMMLDGVKPNEVTFLGLIYACSHVGLVSKGRHLFNSMSKDYGIRPSLEHYTSLLDLLSRSGHLGEAEELLKTMPYEPDEAAWAALLSACRQHKNTKVAVRVADHLLCLGPKDPSTLILLSNTYAAASMWERVSKVRKLMSVMDFRKEPGCSCIELAKESQVFYAGDSSHPMKDQLLGLLKELDEEMRKRGYVPDTSYVLHDLEQHEKDLLFMDIVWAACMLHASKLP